VTLPLADVTFATGAGVVVASVRGEIDMSNARDLAAEVEAAIPNGALRIVIDLTHTTYLDSAGVQLLFVLADRLAVRRHQVRLVVPPDSPVRAVLELTSLPKLVAIEPSRGDAP
jgi:anti-anti-sigma factor